MKLLNFIIVSFLVVKGFSQNVEFKSSNFKDDKEGLKQAISQIEIGDEFFEMGLQDIVDQKDPEKNFKYALNAYLPAQEFNGKSALLNYKIGVCYLYLSSKEKAPKHLKLAHSLDPEVDALLPFFLGQVYQLEEDFDEATKWYNAFKQSKGYDDYAKYVTEYSKACGKAKEIKDTKLRVWVDNLSMLNSEADEMGPTITADGDVLLFSSNRSNGHSKNDLNEYDFDIYEFHPKDKSWTSPKSIKTLNSDKDDINGSFSYDGQRLLIHKYEENNYNIYESKLNGVNWGTPEVKMQGLPTGNDFNETFACYEPLDIKVHFVSDNGNIGGKDIFLSGKMVTPKQTTWGRPSSVGYQINTKFHEGSIYMHPNSKVMYFSSQGHNSLGGYDIYRAEFVNGQWINPVNLGYPINTPYDELFYAGTADGKYAYIVSNRPGGEGGYDLYKVTYWGLPKEPNTDSEDFLLASIAEPIKNDFISQKAEVNRQSLTIFKGNIIDQLTKESVGADIIITDNVKNEVINTLNSNSATGKFLISLPAGRNYGIAVKAEGYLFHSENFIVPEEGEFEMIEKTIELKNISIGSKIALRNIFFDVGKANLKPESYPELDRVEKLLSDVPSLKIELSGHTDNTGSEPMNVKLSQDRANAVKQYLVQKGISASRLTSKGYGSSMPISDNGTESGRQQNRRTEFEIIEN